MLEEVEFADGTARTFEYFWGADKSGTEQGAGGVGGLLAVSVDGVFHVPYYDSNGNVLRYVSEDGSVAAQFVYDPYGNVLEQEGAAADSLRIRFSTKYADSEVGVVSYLMRFYSPVLGRWLSRDPVGEEGGMNLYGFCGNDSIGKYDKDGCAYFAKRKLSALFWSDNFSTNSFLDKYDLEVSHEHLFFGTPESPKEDLGYFKDGRVRRDYDKDRFVYVVTDRGYDDCIMRKAVEKVEPNEYSLFLGIVVAMTIVNRMQISFVLNIVNWRMTKIKCQCQKRE